MTSARLQNILSNSVELIQLARAGLKFELFDQIVKSSSFAMKDWCRFLHLTERTIQRYRKENRTFETIQAEKIIEITRLQKRGIELFEKKENFNQWLNSTIIALGGAKPVDLLDTNFGIDLVMDELGRIEHGLLS